MGSMVFYPPPPLPPPIRLGETELNARVAGHRIRSQILEGDPLPPLTQKDDTDFWAKNFKEKVKKTEP